MAALSPYEALGPVFYPDLEQHTPEWYAWRGREQGIGASEVAAILGIDPYEKALHLWERRTGRRPEKFRHAAMRRGNELEPEARRKLEFEVGGEYRPMCVSHRTIPWLRASLDGWNLDLVPPGVEIKCPNAETHQMALDGIVPIHYFAQIQAQIEVTGVSDWGYFSFDGRAGKLLYVKRDNAFIADMLPKLEAFHQCLVTDTAPVDDGERFDADFLKLAKEYRNADYWAKEWEANREAIRDQLLAMAAGEEMHGGGVTVGTSKGTINYKQALDKVLSEQDGIDYRAATAYLLDTIGEPVDLKERFPLPPLDLEQFRGADGMRVSVARKGKA